MSWRQEPCYREVHEGTGETGRVLCGDARVSDLTAYRGRVQCVYIDPPFNTGEQFVMRMRIGQKGWETGSPTITLPAYSDHFDGKAAYLSLLRELLTAAHSLLCDSGSLFLHLDSRMSAYARLMCDEIFGEKNFVNEIIWSYQTGGRSTKRFSRKHDVIFFYQKTRKLFFNIEGVPISRAENRTNHMRRHVDADGRAYRTIRSGGKVYTYYDDEPVYPGDVWADVSHLQQKDPQRTGYDTQKPQALLERILFSSTRPGDLVADLCCGSGTTLCAAAQNGRAFLGLDQSPHAIAVTRKRLLGSAFTLERACGAEGAAMHCEIVPGIGFYDIRLLDYSLPEGVIPSTVQGLDAVDQWSVGFLKEGIFYGHAHAARRKQTPQLPPVLQLPQLSGTPAVLLVDVLGNATVWVEEA